MAKKGYGNTPGVPELWNETKKRYSLTLTPTAARGLDAIAAELEISRSELVERLGRADLESIAIELGLSRQQLLDEIKRRLPSPPCGSAKLNVASTCEP